MGALVSQYDPFSVYGQHNLKDYAYKNKSTVIVSLVFVLIIIIGIIIMLWTTGEEPAAGKQRYNIPPPMYGDGPYGKGLYLPPTDILINAVNNY
jgi:hypothetical protein